jgi:uncharacterized protein (DUF983 family)
MPERTKSKRFDPSKYGMSCCPDCRGTGKLFDQYQKVRTCNACGGFGWIKKERNNLPDQKEFTEVHRSTLVESGE